MTVDEATLAGAFVKVQLVKPDSHVAFCLGKRQAETVGLMGNLTDRHRRCFEMGSGLLSTIHDQTARCHVVFDVCPSTPIATGVKNLQLI